MSEKPKKTAVRYTEAENEAIKRLWPRAAASIIQEALPGRAMDSLRVQAARLKVRRDSRENAGTPVLDANKKAKQQKSEARTADVVITAAELRQLPHTHPGRQAYNAAAHLGGPAAQDAYKKWQQSQPATPPTAPASC